MPNMQPSGGATPSLTTAPDDKPLEGVSFPLWDTGVIAAAGTTTSLRLFQTPTGQGGKNGFDTNMIGAGQIKNGAYYDIYSIGFGLQTDAATEIPPDEARAIIYGGYLEIYMQERLMFPARLDMVPYGGGIGGLSGIPAAGEMIVANGVPDHNSRYHLKRKIRLPQNTQFAVNVYWPTAPAPTADIRAIVWLDGVLWRYRI